MLPVLQHVLSHSFWNHPEIA